MGRPQICHQHQNRYGFQTSHPHNGYEASFARPRQIRPRDTSTQPDVAKRRRNLEEHDIDRRVAFCRMQQYHRAQDQNAKPQQSENASCLQGTPPANCLLIASKTLVFGETPRLLYQYGEPLRGALREYCNAVEL